jgi:hypothetical protein
MKTYISDHFSPEMLGVSQFGVKVEMTEVSLASVKYFMSDGAISLVLSPSAAEVLSLALDEHVDVSTDDRIQLRELDTFILGSATLPRPRWWIISLVTEEDL